MAGQVLVNDERVTKAGQQVSTDANIRIQGEDHPYVSRGGIKLAGAIERFKINVTGAVALDVGASTGGFTQVLLMHGAKEVFAIDVGHNQLDWKIRTDPRVRVFEKINARTLPVGVFDGTKMDVVVADVSFISLSKIIPAVVLHLKPGATAIFLIKPQFEVGPEKVGPGGIVTDSAAQQAAVEEVTRAAAACGLVRHGLIESPIRGTEGNLEYLGYFLYTP